MVEAMGDDGAVQGVINAAEEDFRKKVRDALRKGSEPLPDTDLTSIQRVSRIAPLRAGVIDEVDSWVMENLKDAARAPSENEWRRLKHGPLDGKIGMSFAVQLRCAIPLLM
jgi:hypothetical protein